MTALVLSPIMGVDHCAHMAGGIVDPLRYALATINKRISALADKVRAIGQDLIKVNAKEQRAGATVENLIIGLHDVAITWPKEWPDTAYIVIPTVQVGDAALGNVHAILKPGSKTTTGCVIRVRALVLIGTVGVDVLGVRT